MLTTHDWLAAADLMIQGGNVHGAKRALTKARMTGAKWWHLSPRCTALSVHLMADGQEPVTPASIRLPVSVFDPLVNW